METIDYTIGDDTDVSFPSGHCCNCYAELDVHQYEVQLKKVIGDVYFSIKTEPTINLALPFCSACKSTAYKAPPSYLFEYGFLWGSFLLSMVVFVVLGFIFNGSESWMVLVVACIFAFLQHSVRNKVKDLICSSRPDTGPTSSYQPVRFLSKRGKYAFGFTCKRYYEKFLQANKIAIDDKKLVAKLV